MGRLIHIEHFLSKEAQEEEKAYAAEIRKAKRDVLEDQAEDKELSLRQVQIALKYHERFEGRIICRTTKSVNWQGNVLIDLPPCDIILGVVNLTKREMDIISAETDSVSERWEAL